MTLRNKILIPFFVILVFLICFFVFLLMYLNTVSTSLDYNVNTIQRIDDLSTRIVLNRQETRFNILAYDITRDTKYLKDLEKNNQEIHSLILDIKPIVTTAKGKQLLNNFETSLNEATHDRKLLLSAIQNSSDDVMKRFGSWDIKTQYNFAALLDFSSYNLHALERNHELVSKNLFTTMIITGLILILLTITFILFLYFYLWKNITRPIEQLSVFAKYISEGKFHKKVTITSKDELGDLARSLDDMAVKLKKYYRSLQNQVKRKEIELQKIKELELQKDNFLSIASHELKTPVTSLKVYTQFLRKDAQKKQNAAYIQYLEKMDDQINYLTGLVSSLLDATKIRAGKMPFKMQYFDLNKCIQEKIEVMVELAKKHTIIHQGSVKKKIYGDQDRINQVIDNLLSNAIKYSPEGGKILIRVLEDKEQVTVSVQDFGLGMDQEQQKKVFDRFYRAADDQINSIPGLGIGLYICSEIVKGHNGKIWVESEKGKGSIFRFTIPYTSKQEIITVRER